MVVTFDNGTKNFMTMYFRSHDYAVKAIEQELAAHGWSGVVKEVGQLI